jgi:hypothetical protein
MPSILDSSFEERTDVMRFFFPDSQDQVDPLFDFISEEHPVHRVRQRDDRYAHEMLRDRPFDGLLISKSIVDGRGGLAAGRYSTASRNRLYREGARRFFRMDTEHADVTIMGDCGAFTYMMEEVPPYTVAEVLDFYEHSGLDWGVAPDHIIFGFVRDGDPVPEDKVPDWERRRTLTITNAGAFLDELDRRQCRLLPVGVAHGWSADTYAKSVVELQALGYTKIALGGMVPLKTRDIVATLEVVGPLLSAGVGLHLLGVTRTDEMATFARFGVTSFDSTSPFRQAFKDESDNYYTLDSTYVAIKVPQVDGNAALKRQIKSGVVDQRAALVAERACLQSLRAFAAHEVESDVPLEALQAYAAITGEKVRTADYRRTLDDRPWEQCKCGICESAGIEVMLFRGSERNKRRGFHNLAAFRHRIARNGFHSLRKTDRMQ